MSERLSRQRGFSIWALGFGLGVLVGNLLIGHWWVATALAVVVAGHGRSLMGWIAVNKQVNEVFVRELRTLDRSDHWKRFAISGRMLGEIHDSFPSDGRPGLEGTMGHHYVGPAEDRRAWLWGYHWKPGGPPPEERPEGACSECWRLGEACDEHRKDEPWLT